MHFQLLALSAALAAAAPGNPWDNLPNFPGGSSSSIKAATTSYTVKAATTSSAKPYYTTSAPASPGQGGWPGNGGSGPSVPSFSYSQPSGGNPGWPGPGNGGPGSGTCAASTVTVTVTASGNGGPGGPGGPPSGPTGLPSPPAGGACYLNDDNTAKIVSTYESLISRSIHGAQFNATASSLLADTYSLQSNSINQEEGLPLETVSIPNKFVFISIFWNQPSTKGDATLDTFHSCNKIAWRWLGTSPLGNPVRGITTMEITSSGQVGPVYMEYFRPELYNCTVPAGA